jgi:preprotein translocase subunit SecD
MREAGRADSPEDAAKRLGHSMERAFYWKAGFIAAVTVLALWCMVPTLYYFQLPPDDRNVPEKLEAAIPRWAPGPKTKVNLGLDLQGGIHLVLGVDVETALKAKASRRADQVLAHAKEKSVSGITATAEGTHVKVSAGSKADADSFEKLALDYFSDMYAVGASESGFTIAFQDQHLKRIKDDAVDQALKVISNRVNRWGVTEPIIAKRGNNAILVQLPGFKDPAKAKELLGKTAQLEFKIVDDENQSLKDLKDLPAGVTLEFDRYNGAGGAVVSSPYLKAMGDNSRKLLEDATQDKLPAGADLGLECIASKVKKNICDGYRTYLLKSKVELTGESVVDARALLDQSQGAGGKPYVALTFDAQGAKDFEAITGNNVMKRMAIVLDQTVNSAPVIQGKIGGGNASITLGGLRPYQELVAEANDLALVLKAGALPAPVTIQEERTVGASLGPELIRNGTYAVLLGLALVIAFMFAYYKVTGLVADVALLLNGLLILAAMAAFNATLTLPGIAGFVLTLGIAVDANVLINERIREELRHGKTTRAAMEAGYDRAFWTIFDAHVTALIAGFVLLQYGSGPVRGFAVMLIIGLLASLFTSIVVTRAIMEWLIIGRGWQKVSV